MVEKFRDKGGSVIIGGDFNEEDISLSEMNKRMKGMGLVNAIANKEGDTSETYKNGKR